jgi:hypothetical protein
MRPEEEILKEEAIEEEEDEVEESKTKPKRPRRGGGEYEITLDIEDLAIKEAINDILAINESIPKEPVVKSPELQEFITFKHECEALMEMLKPYLPQDQDIDILSEDFDMKKAMLLVKKLAGIDGKGGEDYIEGEPSPYAQELFKKVWQKYVDCRWFFSMMKGKKPTTPKELKYIQAPEDLIKATGEKI